MLSNLPARDTVLQRNYLSRLLSTAGPILIVSCPAAVLAQVATNTARVAAPVGTFEAATANNVAVETDALFAVLVAVVDTAGPVNGANGTANALNVIGNDTFNGLTPNPGQVIISVTAPASNPGVALDPASGLIGVAAGVPAGAYAVGYRICEANNLANCAAATATVTVAAPAIAAANDTPAAVNGADGFNDLINAFANDSLNGVPVSPALMTATVTTPAMAINGGAVPVLDPLTGLVYVAPGTPSGTYTIGYRICENNNPANCADGVVTIQVLAPAIAASGDTYTGIRSAIGTPNAGTVLSNDTLNGVVLAPAAIALRVVAPASNSGVMLDPATGQVSVDPSVPAGTYAITYEICERLNPANCAQATATVTVDPALSSIAGTVFDDRNGNQGLDGGEVRRDGWVIEIIRDGVIVATTRTDATGNYRVDGLLSGGGYSIQFRNPENNVVYRVIKDVALANNAVMAEQNLPIDPSGVIYDSITRVPVRGAVVSLLGTGGVPLLVTCFLSPTQQSQATDSTGFYRFDIVPGASPFCPAGETTYTISIIPPSGYSAPSSVLPANIGPLDPTGMSAPVMIASSINVPAAGETVRWYQSFRLATGDPDVIFNHIPLDPFLSRTPLVVTKTSIKRSANVGDLIPYTITVRNTEAAQRGAVDVVDILPPGLKYVSGSAAVNGLAAEPLINNRELRWERQTIPANGTMTYQLMAVVGAGVTTGDRVNTGVARNDLTDAEISNRGQAVISIVPSTVFDCAEVIGKVYDDLNRNGYQDQGEPGIAGARLATVNGELVTTDAFGRYHIACAAVPDAQIGSNFVLKLDVRTVAQGYASTADNPQSIRLTRGKLSELNFGVHQAASTALDIDASAFLAGTSEIKPEIARRLAALRPEHQHRLVFQINYRADSSEDWNLAEQRLAAVKAALAAQFTTDWDAPAPVIEANVTRAFGMPGRE